MSKLTTHQDICKAALDKWGATAQEYMLFEEMSELQKEICKHRRGKDNQAEIAEEIADVEIMLEQMKILFGCERYVPDYKAVKLERLRERIEEELRLYLNAPAALRSVGSCGALADAGILQNTATQRIAKALPAITTCTLTARNAGKQHVTQNSQKAHINNAKATQEGTKVIN